MRPARRLADHAARPRHYITRAMLNDLPSLPVPFTPLASALPAPAASGLTRCLACGQPVSVPEADDNGGLCPSCCHAD